MYTTQASNSWDSFQLNEQKNQCAAIAYRIPYLGLFDQKAAWQSLLKIANRAHLHINPLDRSFEFFAESRIN